MSPSQGWEENRRQRCLDAGPVFASFPGGLASLLVLTYLGVGARQSRGQTGAWQGVKGQWLGPEAEVSGMNLLFFFRLPLISRHCLSVMEAKEFRKGMIMRGCYP